MSSHHYDARIAPLELTAHEYVSFIGSPYVDEHLAGSEGVGIIVVRDAYGEIAHPGSLPVVVCAISDRFGGNGPTNADVVISDADLPAMITSVERSHTAAVSLAVLLRALPGVTVASGLAMESAVYSTLQAGADFTKWLASQSPCNGADGNATVTIDRYENHLSITLARPHRHNAISMQVRDDLCEALSIAVVDPSIETVSLRGDGPSFSSGGDLQDFGRFTDPALAHVTRLSRSPARLIHVLRNRITAHIHGYTLGGGIEMAAFAHHVVAAPDTVIGLPEIEIGLIPGAGGTVSLTRRIGRQRTAALALTGRHIGAETAREWGLINEIKAG